MGQIGEGEDVWERVQADCKYNEKRGDQKCFGRIETTVVPKTIVQKTLSSIYGTFWQFQFSEREISP